MDKFDENKKFFGRYIRYVKQIERLKERYNELSLKMRSINSKNLDGMPRGGTVHFMDDDVIELDELEHRINLILSESKTIKDEIVSVLDHLDNPNKSAILEEHFIYNKPLDVVADDVFLSERQTRRLYSQALNEIDIEK